MTAQCRKSFRWLISLVFLLLIPLFANRSAHADAQPAAQFVSENIQKGLTILNNPQLTPAQRGDQFERLLLGITDMKRIAMFTLGQYARTASEPDQDAFAAAFQGYSVAVYRSYLGRYAGQTLRVTGSSERSPTDFIVATQMVGPSDRNDQQALEVDFRVRTDTGKPEITDLGVAGIWLAVEERDQFGAFLAQNHGDVHALIEHLQDVARGYH